MPDRSRVRTQTKKGYPGPPGWGFGMELTTPHSKKNLLLRKSSKGISWIDLMMMDGKGRTQKRMERRSRKRSSSVGSEKM
jgi:hypothetical protein